MLTMTKGLLVRDRGMRQGDFLRRLCVAMMVIWGGVVGLRAQNAPAAADPNAIFDAPEFQADPATPVFRRTCALCHTPDRVVASRRTGLEWGEIIEKMVTKGAKGSDEDLQTVFFFLVSHFGRVNINSAPADEIAAVLGVSPETGQAIVQFRTNKGRFEGVDSLAKVPGVEASKLNPDALNFK
jgi:competence ComEA-like helix-hairpin-helix protein